MTDTTILTAGPLSLDLADQSAALDGRPVELGPKVFALLKVLMEAPQRVVTKEELFDTVWEGRFVSEAVLTTTIRDLRKAIGDDAKAPAFIGTAHGRGYRFLMPVERREGGQPAPEPSTQPLPPPFILPSARAVARHTAQASAPASTPPTAQAERGGILQFAAWFAVVLIIGAVALASPLLGRNQASASITNPVVSLAVLPFRDLSSGGAASPGEERGILADGMSEEIHNVLMDVDGLTTASRTSAFAYRDRTDMTAREIARALGVSHVLEGTVRMDEKRARVRVSVRLVVARSDRAAWARDYERELSVENVFVIEDEIAERVVAQMRTALGGALGAHDAKAHSAAAGTRNMRAYEAYLKARELFVTREDMPRALGLARESVAADPGFARGWEMLAAVTFAAGERTTKEGLDAVETALKLDPSLSLAHAVRGMLNDYKAPVDWGRGEDAFERALELDPNNTTALLWYANHLHKLGFLERSQTLLERCLQLDAAYDRCRLHLAWVLQMRGAGDRALDEYQRLIRDGGKPVDTMLLATMLSKGLDREARASIARIPTNAPMPETVFAALKNPQANHDSAMKPLQDWVLQLPHRTDAYPIILQLKAYHLFPMTLGSNFALWLPETPEFRRSDYFKAFIRSMRIETYWRERGFPPQCRPLGPEDFECD